MKHLVVAILLACSASFSSAQEALKIVWLEKYAWKLLDNQENGQVQVIHVIPGAETAANWTMMGQMMSLKGTVGANLEEVRDIMFKEAKKEAPKATLTTLEKDESAPFPWILFSVESPSFKNDPNPESQLWYIRQGATSLYINHIAVKKKKLDDEFLRTWSEVFKASEIVQM